MVGTEHDKDGVSRENSQAHIGRGSIISHRHLLQFSAVEESDVIAGSSDVATSAPPSEGDDEIWS